MSIFKGNLVLAAAISLVLAGCGGDGASESVVTESEADAALQDSAADVTSAVEEQAGEAGDVIEQAADSSAAAVESATDSVMDAADNAGWSDLQGNWQDTIASVKDRWADLSDEELMSINGDKDALVTLVQDKYGLDREAAEAEVNDWASSL